MTTVALAAPVALIGLIQWLMPSLMPATIPFGVRIPRDRADAPVIAGQRRHYRVAAAVVAVLATAAALAAPPFAPLAVLAEMLAGVGLYLRARARVTAVKTSEEWFEGRRQVVVADTSLRTDPERYPWPWSLPALALTTATVVTGILHYPSMPARLATHYDASGGPDHFAAKSFGTAFGPVLAQVGSTVLLLGLAAVALRTRAQLDAEDPQAATRHRRFVAGAARALLVLAACASVTFLFTSLATWGLIHPPVAVRVALSVVPIFLGVAALLVVAVRVGQGGSRVRLTGVAAGGARTVNRDDDRLYRWGIVYFNRDDPAVLVPKRFGFGWTLNLARPVTWLVFAAIVAMALLGTVVR